MSIKNRLKIIERQRLEEIKAEWKKHGEWVKTLTPEQLAAERARFTAELEVIVGAPGFEEWLIKQPEYPEKFVADYDSSCFNEMVRRFRKLQKI